ncbi:MAG TPA: DUF3108 domain-containing protein [Desulfobulbus sp.]|nr:DUF3108 domain-containing protein [Desulfobulbus sp.]
MKKLLPGLCLLLFLSSLSAAAREPVPPAMVVDQSLVRTVFSGDEEMHYVVSWSGGIKIGDLFLTVKQAANDNGYVIRARVKDYGLFRLFYPVNDTFTTYVRGAKKLPYRYEVEQKEGHGPSTTHRLTIYDQEKLQVRYQKNKGPLKKFTLTGPVYNEFSSFFITRALNFTEGQPVVPTFVDEKRHEVAVALLAKEKQKKSIFGKVDTLKVMPKMDFKGLYDKDGDTVFWLTDDHCRIPVAIHSKILVGSLVAELVEYKNPACPKWTGRKKKKQKIELGD